MNQLRKTELGIATGIFLLVIFSLLYNSVTYDVVDLRRIDAYFKFKSAHQVFDYYKHYLLPWLANITIVYLAFISVNTWIMPSFFDNGRWKEGSLLLIVVLAAIFIVYLVSNTWHYGYLFGRYKTVKGVHTYCAKVAFVTTIFYATMYALYYAAKQVYFHQVHPMIVNKPWYKQVMVEVCVILVGLITFISILPGLRYEKVMILTIMALYFSFVYFVSQYRLLPRYAVHQQMKILIRDAVLVCLVVFVASFLFIIFVRHINAPALFGICLSMYIAELFIVLPLSYWIFTMRQSRSNTIMGLRRALDQSETGLDFLRWQINPHFLFNALNTLYGTALMEKAPATGEGIQKLGDMMRFMLHDNLLERISLSKEIAYLENYIALQRLRTQGATDIHIEVNINDALCDHEIAPMLLIPFVENAFKHGISQRSKSRITISLSCTESKIYFDVYNTVHASRAGEIEKDSMGIGLHNVRQRLALLYANKHDLNIRETTTEYFVHLTIDVV